jgi:sugar phosphate isomerase/epimerase
MSLPLALHLPAVWGLYKESGLEATLEAVVSAGYEGVEFSGCMGLRAPQIRSALVHTGLRPISYYAEPDDLSGSLSETLDFVSSIGTRYLVYSRKEGDCDFAALAPKLVHIANKAAEYGMVFCYHHFAEELHHNPQGGLWLDTLMGPNAGLIHLEVDTYWAERAGVSAITLLKRYATRCPLLHISDMRDTDSCHRAEIGSGVINLLRVVELAKVQGAEWFIVDENGAFTDSHDGIRRSAGSLRQLAMGVV